MATREPMQFSQHNQEREKPNQQQQENPKTNQQNQQQNPQK